MVGNISNPTYALWTNQLKNNPNDSNLIAKLSIYMIWSLWFMN